MGDLGSPRSTIRVGPSGPVRLDPRTGTLSERTYRVRVTAGPDVGAEVELVGTLFAGTHPDAPLRLTDPTVSRRHLELEARAEGVRVRDLESLNGTLHRGIQLADALLEVRRPVKLKLGQTELEIALVESKVELDEAPTHFGDARAESAGMRRVFGILRRAAPTTTSVVLLGETGTGKDVLARALHRESNRRKAPFVVVDCGAIAPTLIESELFGHVKGAFSGATSTRNGAFLQAHGGTLFLDELGELPLDLQPKLLRAVESGMIRRVGEDEPKRVNVRLVTATHRDLEAQVKAGTFRKDLFFRLAVVMVELPPLRDRPEDIPLLIRLFEEELGGAPVELSGELLKRFSAYRWPGNVRELRNVVQRLHAGGEVELTGDRPSVGVAALKGLPFKDAKERLFEAFAREYLEVLVKECQGNMSEVARRAGINRNHVQKLVDRYQLKAR